MRRHYIVYGILLILPTIDFAVAAPVPVQDKHQAGFDVAHVRKDATTMLKKRGDPIDKLVVNLNHFANPKFSLDAARPSLKLPPSAPPNPGPSTESGYEAMKVDAPLSAPVFPTWFHPDHADYGLMKAHASLPKSGPPNPSTESDSGQRLVVEEPSSSTKGPSTGSRP